MTRNLIALFLPSLAGGGAERMMLNLARGFADEGRAVDLVLARAAGPYLEDVPAAVEVVGLGARRVLTALPGLARYLARRRPAALLSALEHANLVALWARQLSAADTRVVVSVHNTLSVGIGRGGRLGDRLAPLLARRFYPRAQAIVAVSGGVAADFAALTGLPRGRVQVVYNPVVTPELATLAAEPLEHPWFAAAEPPVVLAVGRLTEQKGFPTLIAAFSRVREQLPARLLILGEGPERPRLEAGIRRAGLAGAVRLEGFVGNPFPYMRRARLFVLSSAWEGLPTVLIQAMACGTDVVSTDCPSGPREILEGGRLAPLVPVGDPEALARAILETLRRPPAAGPLRARAGDFSLGRITRQYLDLLAPGG